MKMHDVSIAIHNGKVVLCRRNKRGNIKSDYVDVTSDFLDCITDLLVSPKGKIFIHTDKHGKHYSIDINEMSDEEYRRREESRKGRASKAASSLQVMLLSAVGFRGNLFR